MPLTILHSPACRTRAAALRAHRCAVLVASLALAAACSSDPARGVPGLPAAAMPPPSDALSATAPPIGCAPLSAADRVAILERLNGAREQPRRCGTQAFGAAGPLAWDSRLEQAARSHSLDMATHDFFSHTGSDGLQISDRLRKTGYPYGTAGENIAAGQQSEQDALIGWLGSDTHCRNIMEPAYTETALACVADPDAQFGSYWTQVFGARR